MKICVVYRKDNIREENINSEKGDKFIYFIYTIFQESYTFRYAARLPSGSLQQHISTIADVFKGQNC